ncbi:cyclophilin-like fold protein [Enterocloster bolteae]|uniref:cyclophilin-like fold protein n=1 Tax=Enterocloster bolteae TaxID=208479 RepID=UPI0028DC65D6|nr:cyclophilin-like fold protein [Enterocloster bolteae]
MKKWISWILAICLLTGLTACGKQTEETKPQSQDAQPGIEESEPIDTAKEEETIDVPKTGQEHILIAYFSWADNTVVENEQVAVQSALSHYESVGDSGNYSNVDATSSASVVAPGNTARMAQWIQEYVGGDLFPIVVTTPYSDNYDECLDRAADEKAENARPELADHLDNIDDYDVIFLGFPNWWYTAPMAVFSFIEEYDFSGKTIVPFCAHGTGGIASSVRDITAALPDSAEVLEPIGIYREEIGQAQSEINEWLAGLGFQEKEGDTVGLESGERKLKMTIDGHEVFITLYDTPAADALYDMLPLELNFEDFNGVEKISYLTQELPTEGEPDGCEPDVGDLCLYAPWGNLSVFYQDFRYSDGLIMLGHIDSDMELISGQSGDFTVTLEAAN